MELPWFHLITSHKIIDLKRHLIIRFTWWSNQEFFKFGNNTNSNNNLNKVYGELVANLPNKYGNMVVKHTEIIAFAFMFCFSFTFRFRNLNKTPNHLHVCILCSMHTLEMRSSPMRSMVTFR